MARKYQPVIIIHVDGSCLGNPGPGGWAALLRLNNNKTKKKLITGRSRRTTNNRMELRAVIAGLEAIKQRQHVEIYSDSQYVVKGATIWLHNWKRSGWRNADTNKPIKNRDLWEQLDTAIQRHSPVDFYWVKGHANNAHNEAVDQAARQAAYEVTSEDKEDVEA